ncbi:MAG: hypothetical protein JRD87_10350 [Deltaproteobacteria bacterium]|nr:hypothetical protein [Deltaproteobacteria bacterium]
MKSSGTTLSLKDFVPNVQKTQLRTMLDDYFQHQADLSDLECNLHCPNDCSAPGCRMADVIVEATLFDLIRLGRFLNTPVSHLFSQDCYLGLMICEDNIRLPTHWNDGIVEYWKVGF